MLRRFLMSTVSPLPLFAAGAITVEGWDGVW